MTRRDYVRIAAALRTARERCENIGKAPGRSRSMTDRAPFGVQIAFEAIADMLAADNPRFDLDRFDRAVYGEVEA